MPDDFVQRTCVALNASEATSHAALSLRNWVAGTAGINRVETEFLAKERDLMALTTAPNEALFSLETFLVRFGTQFCASFRNVSLDRRWGNDWAHPQADEGSELVLQHLAGPACTCILWCSPTTCVSIIDCLADNHYHTCTCICAQHGNKHYGSDNCYCYCFYSIHPHFVTFGKGKHEHAIYGRSNVSCYEPPTVSDNSASLILSINRYAAVLVVFITQNSGPDGLSLLKRQQITA